MYASVESQCIVVLDEKRRNYIGWDKLVRAYYHLPSHTAHRPSSSLLLSSFSSPCVMVFESLPSASSLLHSSVSLLVSNLTVAATISREGFHLFRSPSFVSPDQPPSAKDRSPHLLDLLASLQRLCQKPTITRCRNCNWIKISTLVMAIEAADKGITGPHRRST